jgi:bifunctional DNA-binding transcriptional regulator/antitoxin component of YhaV-PrlF toxin-antitoxin module
MTRKLNPTKVERVDVKSKSRVLVPKKYIAHLGIAPGDFVYVTSLSYSDILTKNPTPLSFKKLKVDKDGAIRFKSSSINHQIFVADGTVVLG